MSTTATLPYKESVEVLSKNVGISPQDGVEISDAINTALNKVLNKDPGSDHNVFHLIDLENQRQEFIQVELEAQIKALQTATEAVNNHKHNIALLNDQIRPQSDGFIEE